MESSKVSSFSASSSSTFPSVSSKAALIFTDALASSLTGVAEGVAEGVAVASFS